MREAGGSERVDLLSYFELYFLYFLRSVIKTLH